MGSGLINLLIYGRYYLKPRRPVVTSSSLVLDIYLSIESHSGGKSNSDRYSHSNRYRHSDRDNHSDEAAAIADR
jgi:hypothetical protein